MPDPQIRVNANFQRFLNTPNMVRTSDNTIWFIADQADVAGLLYKSTDSGLTWATDVNFCPIGYGSFAIGIWTGAGDKIYCLHEPKSDDSSWKLYFSRAYGGSIETADIQILDAGRNLNYSLNLSSPMTLIERLGKLEAFYVTILPYPGDNARIDRKTSTNDGNTWSGVTTYDSDTAVVGPSSTIFSALDSNNAIHIIYKAGGSGDSDDSWVKHLQIDSDDTATIKTIEYSSTPTPINDKHTIFGVEYDAVNDKVVTLYYNWVDDMIRYGVYDISGGTWSVSDLESSEHGPTFNSASQYKLVRLRNNEIWIVNYTTDGTGVFPRWSFNGSSFVPQNTITVSNPRTSGSILFHKLFPLVGIASGTRPTYTAFAYWGEVNGAYYYYEQESGETLSGFNVDYKKYPADLSTLGSSFDDITSLFSAPLRCYVLWKMLEHENEVHSWKKAQLFKNQYEVYVKAIKETYFGRDVLIDRNKH